MLIKFNDIFVNVFIYLFSDSNVFKFSTTTVNIFKEIPNWVIYLGISLFGIS